MSENIVMYPILDFFWSQKRGILQKGFDTFYQYQYGYDFSNWYLYQYTDTDTDTLVMVSVYMDAG